MARPRSDWSRYVVSLPDAPDTWDPPTPTAALGLFLATRVLPEGPLRAFRDAERLYEALARGDLALDDAVRVEGRVTTAGRCLVDACLPPSVRDPTRGVPWTRAYATEVLARITRELHVELAARAAAALERLGSFVAERSGISLCADDFAPPPGRDALVTETLVRIAAQQRRYNDGRITDGERFNLTLDLWEAATAHGRALVERHARGVHHPLAAFTAALGDATLPTRLCAADGVQTSPRGEIYEAPVRHAPGDGFTPHEWVMLAAKARNEALAQLERDRVAVSLLHDLHMVLADTRVVADDCATRGSMQLRRDTLAEEDGEPTLGARAEGRVLAEDVSDRDGAMLACAGAVVTPARARALDTAAVAVVRVRDVRRCEATGGVCVRCLGRDPDDATTPVLGDAVGARAAFAIARAARTFRRDVFIIGSSGCIWPYDANRDTVRATADGALRCEGLEWAWVAERGDAPARVCLAGGRVAVRRGAFVMESFRVHAGDVLVAEDGATVRADDVLLHRPREGVRALRALLPEGVVATAQWSEAPDDELVDARTGLSRWGFFPGPDDVMLTLVDAAGRVLAAHPLPRITVPRVASGALVRRGDALATLLLERERFDRRRGTEWLREHLDARPPKAHEAAVIAPCDGRVEAYEAQRVVLRTDDERTLSVRRGRAKHLFVREGDFVRAGDALSDGARSHHRLLRIWGADRLVEHMLDELAQQTSLHPGRVAGAWWSLAVRAMLAWRRVVRPGDTGLRRNVVIARDAFERVQRETAARGGELARAVPVLRGFAAMARERLRGGA
jgi:DNA-directed RNA polymerase subunit beta'